MGIWRCPKCAHVYPSEVRCHGCGSGESVKMESRTELILFAPQVFAGLTKDLASVWSSEGRIFECCMCSDEETVVFHNVIGRHMHAPASVLRELRDLQDLIRKIGLEAVQWQDGESAIDSCNKIAFMCSPGDCSFFSDVEAEAI